MAHGILVSDSTFLNDLIKLNMSALAGCKLAVVSDIEKLKTLLEIDPTYDVIVAMTTLGNREIVKTVTNLCLELLPEAHVFFMGHHNEQMPSRQFHTIKNHNDVIQLVKVAGEVLKIKLATTPAQEEADYFPIPVQLLENVKAATQDFWQPSVAGNTAEYLKLAVQGEPLESKISLWKNNKIKTVYVKKEHKAAVITAMTLELTKHLIGQMENTPAPSAEDAINSNKNLVDQAGELFAQVFTDPETFAALTPEVKEQLSKTAYATEKLVRGIVKTVPTNLNKLVELFQKGKMTYIQKHSLLVNFLCVEMSRKETWFTSQVYSTLSLITFFHDIVLVPIYIKYSQAPEDEVVLLNMPELNETERNLVRWHPKVVAQLVSQMPNMPPGMDQLILQHHGNIAGILDEKAPQDEISPLSKLVYVADLVARELLAAKTPLSEDQRKSMLNQIEAKLGKRSYQKLIQPLYELAI